MRWKHCHHQPLHKREESVVEQNIFLCYIASVLFTAGFTNIAKSNNTPDNWGRLNCECGHQYEWRCEVEGHWSQGWNTGTHMAMEREDGHLGNLGRFCGPIWLTSRSMEDKKKCWKCLKNWQEVTPHTKNVAGFVLTFSYNMYWTW